MEHFIRLAHYSAIAALSATLAFSPSFGHHGGSDDAVLATAPMQKTAIDDATIVAIFDAANTWDIEAGELALEKSHTKRVRDFAEMMVRDHKAVRQMGRDLAQRLKVTPTPPGKDFPLALDHERSTKHLRAMRGAAFDTAYINHEVAYHQAVIDAVTTTLLPATKNAELKAFEEKVAPNFQAHLAAAKKVQGELAVTVGAR